SMGQCFHSSPGRRDRTCDSSVGNSADASYKCENAFCKSGCNTSIITRCRERTVSLVVTDINKSISHQLSFRDRVEGARITRIEAIPLAAPEYPQGGWVIIRVHTAAGVEGIGECFVPDP